MSEAVIIDAVRTPYGKRGGALREFRPDALLAHVLRGVVDRAGIDAAKVDDVICGTVTQAGEQATNVARLGVLLADFPVSVPGVTLNRMCGSSQQAVHFAAQAIAAGDARYAIGAGVESMSRVPMFLDLSLGDTDRGFAKLNPQLFEKYELIHQDQSAERVAERWGLTRGDVDEFAKESHRRAAEAMRTAQSRHLLATPGIDDLGNAMVLNHDEGVRKNWDDAKIAALKLAFRAPGKGVVTAANASQISDGAGAVLVADRASALADGLRPKARFCARVVLGDDPTLQLMGVIPATRRALEKSGLRLADIDWIEINEAFACVVLAWARELHADMESVNPWGGAIAHGHPLGASGAGLMAKMLAGLEATGGQFGLQLMCIGHGMATATIIERL
jgi:acetyl-CoA acyltransferase